MVSVRFVPVALFRITPPVPPMVETVSLNPFKSSVPPLIVIGCVYH